MTTPQPLQFTLPTMTCGHCVKTVTATVQRVDAQASLSIDLPTHRVTITSALPAAAFAVALSEEGYDPA